MTANRILGEVIAASQYLNDFVLPSYQYSDGNSLINFLREEYESIPEYYARIAFLTVLATGEFTYDGYELIFSVSIIKCVESYKKIERTLKRGDKIFIEFTTEQYPPCDQYDIVDTMEYIDFFSGETVYQICCDVEGEEIC